jgi:hypothetical protein
MTRRRVLKLPAKTYHGRAPATVPGRAGRVTGIFGIKEIHSKGRRRTRDMTRSLPATEVEGS